MSDQVRAISGGQPAPLRADARPPTELIAVKPANLENSSPKAEEPVKPKFDPERLQAMLRDVVDRLNEQMKDGRRDLGFSVDSRTNTFVVTVKNTNTGEVIRQIPSEVVINLAHSIEDLKGLIFSDES